MDSMYDKLLGLSLFKGASSEALSEILEKTKFHFLKYPAGSVVVDAGDPCTHVRCLIAGSVGVMMSGRDGRFLLRHALHAPSVLAPEFLFGRAPFYPYTATALEPISLLQISKNDYMKILDSNDVFMYNFLNILSMHAQKSVEGILAITTGSLEERLALWVVTLTPRDAVDIYVRARQRDLASLLGVSHRALTAALDRLRQRGIVHYDNTEIRFHSRQAMLDVLNADVE